MLKLIVIVDKTKDEVMTLGDYLNEDDFNAQ